MSFLHPMELFAEFLRKRRCQLVKEMRVVVENHDPTYGASQSTEYVEVVDFDELVKAIDEFGEELRLKNGDPNG